MMRRKENCYHCPVVKPEDAMFFFYICTGVCKKIRALDLYISIYIYGVHCGKILILENIPGHMFIHITLAGSKFSSATLPTMHSIYLYILINIYQFANSCIYLLIYNSNNNNNNNNNKTSKQHEYLIDNHFCKGYFCKGYYFNF